MFVRDHEWYIRHLTEHVHMKPSSVVVVDNAAKWCNEHGVAERDDRRPLRLVPGTGEGGPLMVISERIPEEVLEERVTALRIRSQLKSVAYDRADLLNSDMKKIAYLFLKEYAATIPELAGDEFAADEWTFEQMDRIGIFSTQN